MTHLLAHHTYDDEDPERIIATVHTASYDAVLRVLNARDTDPDGRSQFMWLRLPNGDLMLGVFPQGDTYLECEADAQAPNLERR